MNSKDELADVAKAIRLAPRDMDTLLRLSGLNPATDFRNLDLRNVDFSGCNLAGFNFEGSRIRGGRFTGARVSEAIFDAAHATHADLFADAVDRPTFPPPSRRIVVGGESFVEVVRAGTGNFDLRPHIGGAAVYCAVALGKLGNHTQFLGRISTDSFGELLLQTLAEAEVGALLEKKRIDLHTSMATVHHDEHGRHEFVSGADGAVSQDDLVAAMPVQVAMLYLSGMALNVPKVAEAWLGVARTASARGVIVAVDLEVRPSMISDMTEYRRHLAELTDIAHVIKMSEDDLHALEPRLRPEEYARMLLTRPNCELVVVTLGESGSLAFTRNTDAHVSIHAPPVLGDTVGAGSAFMAGILTALLERQSLEPNWLSDLSGPTLSDILQMGAVVAGLSCGKTGFQPPVRSEVDAAIRGE